MTEASAKRVSSSVSVFNFLGMSSLKRFNKERFKDISTAQRTRYLEGKEIGNEKGQYESKTKAAYSSKVTHDQMTEPSLRVGNHPHMCPHSKSH